ncbi:hypothetical protein P872_00190 [Rhodonellum psychrophilum GCM71 = DSM 17998]|uniref:2Fe-2S ferredoxin-type domain-containing protein n=2 Tax=Rhodonellum TaxID=336827 RepID=U5C143_9BACT|nr:MULTISPECIES: 2Fe-2S iron-sulfur cluster-binding protein [Rhodonellum]ERM83529.1 hypothetical protein P872_00190 [Rhodonellum psychrophilum GCM71 = DSM 17998]
MLKIIIENFNHQEIVSQVDNRKVIELIHENYIDWMHACGKKGRCTSCKMVVTKGFENLSPLTDSEEYFRGNGRLKVDERLSCQAKLMYGELSIKVPEEQKLPHLDYSE